jgi:hypothetical protein
VLQDDALWELWVSNQQFDQFVMLLVMLISFCTWKPCFPCSLITSFKTSVIPNLTMKKLRHELLTVLYHYLLFKLCDRRIPAQLTLILSFNRTHVLFFLITCILLWPWNTLLISRSLSLSSKMGKIILTIRFFNKNVLKWFMRKDTVYWQEYSKCSPKIACRWE